MKKIKVAILFGGKSAEHEISIRSAENVVNAIDKNKYELVLIFIDKAGRWFLDLSNKNTNEVWSISIDTFKDPIAYSFNGGGFFIPDASNTPIGIDVFFPILHGPFGEDGTIQGLFRIMDVPFVGCDVLGSAVAMDKQVMKRLLAEAGLPMGKYLTAFRDEIPTFEQVEKELGLPFYVKPANMGSSVGISRVAEKEAYQDALEFAFDYDLKVVLEENIDGREIECAVLGNRLAKASVVGQIKSTHAFYSYSSKYLDEQGYQIIIPADVAPEIQQEIRQIAVKVFKALDGSGLGRVDVFLKEDGTILVNEMNSMPGFTSISMYPMLWKASGIDYPDLIDNLIELALERYSEFKKLKTSI